MTNDPFELEDSAGLPITPIDWRPHMPEPPPVKLVAIADVRVPAQAGKALEKALDKFYVGLLKFERDETAFAYHAERHRLIFEPQEGIVERDSLRPIEIEVASLRALENELIAREIEYEWQHGVYVGSDTLLFRDPAGGTVRVGEVSTVR